jgi:Mn-dependent DtxR family transcriptional regulator
MLSALLAELRSGGTFETRDLAARLGTTPALMEAMLEHLQRLGQVHTYQSCSDACHGCSLREGCTSAERADGLRLWQI